jgi:hypothetical protein
MFMPGRCLFSFPANAIPYGEELALLQSNDVVSVTPEKARRGCKTCRDLEQKLKKT